MDLRVYLKNLFLIGRYGLSLVIFYSCSFTMSFLEGGLCAPVVVFKKNAIVTGGSIINLSSIAGLIGSPHLVAYGASKGLVRQPTKSIAVHCGREGYRIRCNSIHPGIIRTNMQDQVVALNGGDSNEKWKDRINMIPLGEAGTAEDIANGALFLASDEARHITGAELVIDGGMTII